MLSLCLATGCAGHGSDPFGASSNSNGGGGGGGGGPAPTATPIGAPCPAVMTAHVLWKDGAILPALDSWFGITPLYLQAGGGAAGASIVGVTDTINGDSNTLQVASVPLSGFAATIGLYACPAGTPLSSCPGASVPSDYSNCGKISFNLRLETAPGNLGSLRVEYGQSQNCSFFKMVSPTLFNTATFTHVDLPVNSFTMSCPIPSGNGYHFAFAITAFASATFSTITATPVFTINDIRWN